MQLKSTDTQPHARMIMALFFFTMFVIGTDTFIVSPLLPTLRQVLHISAEQSGWLVSAYALGYAGFALIAGPLSDGFNRKSCLVAGMIGFSLFTAGCGLAADFSTLLALRALAGISAAITSPQVWASIPQLLPAHHVVRAMSAASAGLAVSQCMGVPIGSVLAASNWRFPFFAVAGAALIITVLLAVKLPAIPPRQRNGISVTALAKHYRFVLSERRTVAAFLGYFLYQLGTFATFSFLGNWLADDFALSVQQTGLFILVFGIGNLAGSLMTAPVERWLGTRATVTAALLGMISMYLLVMWGDHIAVVGFAYMMIACMGGILFPLLMNTLQKQQPSARGTIAALANSSMYGGTMIGSSLAGLLYARVAGFPAIVILTMLSYTAALILFHHILKPITIMSTVTSSASASNVER
ncbi:MFS transporter [Paenibacillus sp. MER TA 81-3]|uniref:MFS transporter n=1 Tax=Paenibacillus sp. MER TA 81-3 TaxID=2939573 RepID=UPI00203B7251|nr:MFS transporter [Paenibacillus sp. MER TA 81-3]MCM3338533.1 MFS transporter [Paenibacillus sp. MER TA 81-3]